MKKQAIKKSTMQLVKELKQQDCDFEFYPSTPAILDAVKSDIKDQYEIDVDCDVHKSILDCGAGNGAALSALTKGKKYAIEKAEPLLNELDADIFVVGTDFNQQQLIDKKVDIIYSNPPYSSQNEWASKIISEANASLVYLVLPVRWVNSLEIKLALERRNATAFVIGTFDFGNGERATHYAADVHVLRIDLASNDIGTRGRCYNRREGSQLNVDPFALWFDSNFKVAETMKEQPQKSIEEKQEKEKKKMK